MKGGKLVFALVLITTLALFELTSCAITTGLEQPPPVSSYYTPERW
jgi:hypothetical protein